jgi:hypothetical protein
MTAGSRPALVAGTAPVGDQILVTKLNLDIAPRSSLSRPVLALLASGDNPRPLSNHRLVTSSNVTTYFDQIDSCVPQRVDKTPKTGVVHSHRVQDRASRLDRFDLTEVLKQLKRHNAENPDLVGRLSQRGLGSVVSD